jgi:hypothetical protein
MVTLICRFKAAFDVSEKLMFCSILALTKLECQGCQRHKSQSPRCQGGRGNGQIAINWDAGKLDGGLG